MGKRNLGALILAQVAKDNGVTVDEVRVEIQSEILLAYKDKENRDRWNQIFGENVIPTPEQFVVKMGQLLKKR